MVWRKWLIRGAVVGLAGLAVLAVVVYLRRTNPEAVRQQVLDRLHADLGGAQATLGSARLCLFGCIRLEELRLARRDELDRSDFAYVPSADLYHDKEQVLKGRLRLRKVELHRPRVRLVRRRDGRWNIADLATPSAAPAQPLPTVVVKQGHLILEDEQAAPGTPPLEIKDVDLTLMNDPPTILRVRGRGVSELLGPVRLDASAQRGDHSSLRLTVEALDVPIGSALVEHLAGHAPELGDHARQLQGKGSLHGTFHCAPGQPLSYDVRFKLTGGRFSHARLPWDLDDVQADLHCADGRLLQAEVSGRAGPARLCARLKDLRLGSDLSASLADAVRELEVQAEDVAIDEALFAKLPAGLRSFQQDYRPSGKAAVALTFRRQPSGQWVRRWALRPQAMKARYALFPYLVERIEGSLVYETRTDAPTPHALVAAMQSGLSGAEESDQPLPTDRLEVDLRGRSGPAAVFLKGTVEGHALATGLNLDLWANNVPIDEALLSALPASQRALAESFHPSGTIDFQAFFRRPQGTAAFTNRYLIQFRQTSLRYDGFPYPLENVSGTLDLWPDRWEFRNVVGTHKGGTIRASGRSGPVETPAPVRQVRLTRPASIEPQPTAQRVRLKVQGTNILLDEEFEQALTPGRENLAKAWKALALTGRMNFNAEIDDLPSQPAGGPSLDVTVSVGGCRMKPSFFPYPLEDVSATVRCSRHGVQVADLRGRHGGSWLHADRVTVILKPEGGYWAKFDALRGTRLLPDAALLEALPVPLRNGLTALELKDPFQLETLLVVDAPAEPGSPPLLYWDGSLRLVGASLKAGVPITGVDGLVCVQGRHNGRHLEDVVGNLVLERATVLGQPLEKVHSRLQVWKDSPDILRFKDLKATLYGGQVGGEGRVEFGSIFRYDLKLTALRLDLEQFGRANFPAGTELQGRAQAALHLSGEGVELAGLKGHGQIDVHEGKMYRLPLLLDLLKWLGLRLPDRTAFEQAHVACSITGPRVEVTKLELYGNPISVRGQGRLNLDGSGLDLDLNADWGRWGAVMPSPIRALSREVSNQLLRIKVRGSVGKVQFTQVLAPMVVDPLKRVLNWSN